MANRYDGFDPVYRARVRKGMTPFERFLETGNAVGSNFYELNVRDKTLEEPLSPEEIARKAASRTEDNTKFREYLGSEQEDPHYQKYLREARQRAQVAKIEISDEANLLAQRERERMAGSQRQRFLENDLEYLGPDGKGPPLSVSGEFHNFEKRPKILNKIQQALGKAANIQGPAEKVQEYVTVLRQRLASDYELVDTFGNPDERIKAIQEQAYKYVFQPGQKALQDELERAEMDSYGDPGDHNYIPPRVGDMRRSHEMEEERHRKWKEKYLKNFKP